MSFLLNQIIVTPRSIWTMCCVGDCLFCFKLVHFFQDESVLSVFCCTLHYLGSSCYFECIIFIMCLGLYSFL